jgi:hypothetical protein
MTSKFIGLALAGAALIGGPAAAHHAFNMYDNTKVEFTGVVKSFTWQNPHAMLDVEAAMPGGKTELWQVELSAPNIIGRRGWSKTSLKVGDKVPMVIHPMKDGSRYGLMMNVTLPNGQILTDKR